MPGPYTAEERLQLALDRGIIVDEQDMWLLSAYTWSIINGYVKTALPWDEQGRRPFVFLHHAIMGYPIWEGDTIDHEDRNTLHNSRSNLRYVNHYTQLQNRGFVENAEGVYKNHRGGHFHFSIMRDGAKYYGGTFATREEAITRRQQWLRQYNDGIGSE